MTTEEKIKQDVAQRFAYVSESIVIKRARRISLEVAIEKWPEVFAYLVRDMGFGVLSAITGLDEGDAFGVIYHLSRDGGAMLNVKTRLPKDNPSLPTVTPYFPTADIYERELMDLLGIKVIGLGAGHRYPLADDWPKDDFPLRKDWRKHA